MANDHGISAISRSYRRRFICDYESDIVSLVSDLRLRVLNAAPFENRWWRLTANQGTGFTDEMRMHIAWDTVYRPALPTPSPTPNTASHPQRRRYKRRERKQKRGKCGGIRARLAANPHKPAIPTIVLANVRSLDNKLDYIRLLRSTQRTVRDCCAFVFTETWLNNSVPDCAIQLDQLTFYRADRALVEGGKTRGGGLCVYINDAWCRNAVVVCKHCSSLVEFMIIKCRPFYLPREYTAILLVAVYIPPSSNNNNNRSEALNDLYQHISEQQTAHPDGILIMAGDFNHADLKSVFPKIHQHIDFPTRGKNTLDFVYTTHTRPYPSPILAPQTTSLSC